MRLGSPNPHPISDQNLICNVLESFSDEAPLAQRVENIIQITNHYPADKM